MYKKIFPILILTSFLFSSCKKDLPDVGATAAQSMANEWWVNLRLDGEDLYPQPKKIITSNTANNNNEIWVDDWSEDNVVSHHLWTFKVKAQVDFNTLTFNATQALSVVDDYGIKVDITEGKVIPNGGHSKAGNVTDSIYMKVEFEDDPGTIYEITGHGRTKFIEDEY